MPTRISSGVGDHPCFLTFYNYDLWLCAGQAFPFWDQPQATCPTFGTQATRFSSTKSSPISFTPRKILELYMPCSGQDILHGWHSFKGTIQSFYTELFMQSVISTLPATKDYLDAYHTVQLKDNTCSQLMQFCEWGWPKCNNIRCNLCKYW